MIIDARDVEAGAALQGFDVCIVGGGAAGITMAMELSKGRTKVCLLESGGLEYEDDTQALYKGKIANPHYQDPEISRLRYLGRSTNHWEGSCRPLDPIDFEHRDWVKDSGWPFSRAHLDPFYARAHRYCDLNEFNYDPEFWGRKSGPRQLPTGRDALETIIFQRSEPTLFGAKFKADLEKSENVTVYLHANVTNIELANSAEQVERLDVSVLGGQSFTVSARYYVIAMGGIENARILLLSNTVAKDGVGNSNGLVGRYFMDHPVAKGAIFVPSMGADQLGRFLGPSSPAENVSAALQLSPKSLQTHQLLNVRLPFIPVTKFYASEGVESFHALRRAVSGGDLQGDLWTHVGNVAGDFDMVLEGISRRLFGTGLFDSADKEGFFVFDSMMESPPEADNRVELGEARDALGQRRITLHYNISNAVKENFWRLFRVAAKEFGRSGLGRVRLLELQGDRIWDDLINFGSHHMGTTRSHKDARRGVVDANMKIHDVANLYVAGSSVFPTGGHVPPTLTIVALAIRLAQHFKERLGV